VDASGSDTIAAIATAPGRGGIGVIRISGPRAGQILQAVCGMLPAPRRAALCDFREMRAGEGEHAVLDRGIALYFPAPHSFTGEDVAELQGHGGPVVLDLLLQTVLRQGVRLARPGEFAERAFLNGKIDLAQAEAIADLIDSTTAQAARNAMRSLQGAFSERIRELLQELVALRVFVEASIDFPEEEVDFLADHAVANRLETLLARVASIRASARNGALVRDGMNLVLTGKPNAGKSSIMNALAGRDTAIVTAIPGTTRDVLREEIELDGLPLHIIDTAGLHDSPDPVEQEGIRRARVEIERADHLLLIVDSTAGDAPEDVLRQGFGDLRDRLPPMTVVLNKCDLSGIPAGPVPSPAATIAVSALTGAGMPELRAHLERCAGYQGAGSGDFSARRRHLDALDRTEAALRAGQKQLQQQAAGELLAEHLRMAQQSLGEITGEFTADDLLGRIFASFCIGK
jgi:tRNA modification GTPase